MKNQLLPFFLCTAATTIGASHVVAQPDTAEAPKVQNPDNRRPGANARPNRANMTPEQLQKFLAQRQKAQWARLGVTDEAQQTLLAEFVAKETEEQNKLRSKGRELERTLRGNTVTTDTQIAGLLNDYNAAVEENNERRAKAITALKKSFDLTKFPRVEATLTLGGFIGDGPQVSAGRSNLFGGGPGADFAGGFAGGFAWEWNGQGQNGRNNRPNTPGAVVPPAKTPAGPEI